MSEQGGEQECEVPGPLRARGAAAASLVASPESGSYAGRHSKVPCVSLQLRPPQPGKGDLSQLSTSFGPVNLISMAHRLQMRLLTWDVKDTLIKLRRPVGEEYASKARAHGLVVEATALEQAFGQAYRVHSHNFPNYGQSRGLTSRQWWVDLILSTFHLAGVPDTRAIIPIADQLYTDFSTPSTWQVLEGVETTLRGCQKRGLRLAVISNFDRRLEDILVGLGLREHFDFVLTSEAAGCPKPDPRIFHKALQLACVEPAVAAHVGDSYLCDYQGAQAVGMHSFLVVGQEPLDSSVRDSIPKEHTLSSLSHLLPALDLLEASNPKS
ncbi:haloacid dehalogenase-like hydrolase domain-containing protein 3 isoform X2 [Mesocricetus auratus]|uniref:Haloacid dehalogenase-like hydrolase domain-containing protein 3 n=1 Tax=Mesocricetus auratus TaxID=10036 RepID=A0A1U7QXK1_MESAU|nr:haloacid dehalogenase-like hydrolase domain-containing protein 3 isoform X2 [Mesocricetus auratus]